MCARPIHVDPSFARDLLCFLERPTLSARAHLLRHQAFGAIRRHAAMTGAFDDDVLLDRAINEAAYAPRTLAVADAWSDASRRLEPALQSIAPYLPSGWRFDGTAYLVAGYDIGCAAPPDVLLNVTHPRFVEDPEDLAPWAAHEVHHVGFLSIRAPPAGDLHDAQALLALIRYMTQLEGTAVHAAYDLRAQLQRLEADEDYDVFASPAVRAHVTRAYGRILGAIARRVSLADDEIGDALTAMSSGARLWYRFGALVAWTLERRHGTNALVAAIAGPEPFDETARDLLAAAG